MGSWGYAPRDGDSPHDMEGDLVAGAVAPALIALFKGPLSKGSRQVLRGEVIHKRAKKLGGKAPPRRRRGRPIGARMPQSLKTWMRIQRKAVKALKEENDPASFYEFRQADWEMWGRLGVVQIVSERGIGIPISVVLRCRGYLKRLTKADGFADTWREPKDFKKSVTAMLKYIEAVIAGDKQGQALAKRYVRRRARGVRLIHCGVLRDIPGQRKLVRKLKRAGRTRKKKPKA